MTKPRTAMDGIRKVGYSVTDQFVAAGTMFLINLLLARHLDKAEYGGFVLTYSIFTFLAGLHNAFIVEPFSVFGAGRHAGEYPSYLRFIFRAHLAVSAGLAAAFLCVIGLLAVFFPQLRLVAMAGLAAALPLLYTGAFMRRSAYVSGAVAPAAYMSMIFFVTAAAGLGACIAADALNGFWVFIVLGAAWLVATAPFAAPIFRPGEAGAPGFLAAHPGYAGVHWRYARWVLATAFIFQLTSQGYYWLLAGMISVAELAELRAAHVLILPVDQIYIGVSMLFLPAMARHFADGDARAYGRRLRLMLLAVAALTGTFAACVFLFGTQIMHLVYGGKFDGSAGLLLILSAVPIVMNTGNVFNDALKAAGQPRLVFIAYAVSGLTTFGVGIPLITAYQLRGVAYGMICTALSYTVVLVACYWIVIHRATTRSGPAATGAAP